MKDEIQTREQHGDNSCIYFGGETNPGYIFCLNANMPIDQRACRANCSSGSCMGFQAVEEKE